MLDGRYPGRPTDIDLLPNVARVRMSYDSRLGRGRTPHCGLSQGVSRPPVSAAAGWIGSGAAGGGATAGPRDVHKKRVRRQGGANKGRTRGAVRLARSA